MVKDKITHQKNECEDHYVDEEPECNKTMDTPAEEHDAYDAAGQYFADEYDADVRFAIHDIREDLGRHLNLSSDRQNAMITIVGILLAFASMLFINMYPEDGFLQNTKSFEVASAIFMGVCCAAGIITLLFWKGDKRMDGNIFAAIDRFNEEKWLGVQKELLSGLSDSHDERHQENRKLSKTIKLMVIIITMGMILMIIGRA